MAHLCNPINKSSEKSIPQTSESESERGSWVRSGRVSAAGPLIGVAGCNQGGSGLKTTQSVPKWGHYHGIAGWVLEFKLLYLSESTVLAANPLWSETHYLSALTASITLSAGRQVPAISFFLLAAHAVGFTPPPAPPFFLTSIFLGLLNSLKSLWIRESTCLKNVLDTLNRDIVWTIHCQAPFSSFSLPCEWKALVNLSSFGGSFY